MSGHSKSKKQAASGRKGRDPRRGGGDLPGAGSLFDDSKWVTKSSTPMPALSRATCVRVLLSLANGVPTLDALKKAKVSWPVWQSLKANYPEFQADAHKAAALGREANHCEDYATARMLANDGRVIQSFDRDGNLSRTERVYSETILLRLLGASDPKFRDGRNVDVSSNGQTMRTAVIEVPAGVAPPRGDQVES